MPIKSRSTKKSQKLLTKAHANDNKTTTVQEGNKIFLRPYL